MKGSYVHRVVIFSIFLSCSAIPSQAQVSAAAPAIPIIAADPGKLSRIDHGIVEVKIGAPFDVSQAKGLLTLVRISDPESPDARGDFRHSSGTIPVRLGERINLKLYYPAIPASACFFDAIGFKAPKGATASIVLRVECD